MQRLYDWMPMTARLLAVLLVVGALTGCSAETEVTGDDTTYDDDWRLEEDAGSEIWESTPDVIGDAEDDACPDYTMRPDGECDATCKHVDPDCEAGGGEEMCEAMDATGEGLCDAFFGYKFDGESCVGLGGCSCEGDDCDELYRSPEACEEATRDCTDRCGGIVGRTCDDDEWCDYPDDAGAACGGDDRMGVCKPKAGACDQVQVCGCDGKTYGTACLAHNAGVDVAAVGECE